MGEEKPRSRAGHILKKWVIKRPQGVNIRKTAGSLLAVNIAQIIALGLMLVIMLTDQEHLPDWMLVFVCLTLTVSNLLLTRTSRTVDKYKQQVEEMGQLIGNQNDLNNQLRMQRHDFINHLQVIYGLLQLGESDHAMEYMDKVNRDLQRVGNQLRTRSSAVNALLAAKAVQAEKRGLTLTLNVSTPLDRLPLEDWQLCRILSNLLDNAMDAAEGAADPQISLRLWEDAQGLRFRVINHGPAIPEEMTDRIFRPGVTTKGDRGTGMGLYIVESIVTEWGGVVEVESTEEATRFEGWVPMPGKPPEG